MFFGRSNELMAHRSPPSRLRGDGNLGHLEDDVAAVADDFRADLELFAHRRHGPVLHFLRQAQRSPEVAQIVGQGMKLKPNLVVAELAA